MFLNATEQRTLAHCFSLLAQDLGQREIREQVGHATLALFKAQYFASYVWNEDSKVFADQVSINVDPANLDRYTAWYQHHDPITFELQLRRHATRVSDVMPRADFLRSEFFNDFLAKDGLHWGINLHAFDGDRALGDLRIWRGRGGTDFDARDRRLLDLLEPAFEAALRRARAGRRQAAAVERSPSAVSGTGLLSARELEVARCVRRGLSDKEIARELAISVPTVRTYLRRVFEKLGIHRRSGLAQLSG